MKIFRWLAFAIFWPLMAAADEKGPDSSWTLDSGQSFISPKGSVQIEQYHSPEAATDYCFQMWIFTNNRRSASLLNPNESGTTSGYPAGFRCTADEKWIVRMQKLAAGESTLFLYKRVGENFVPATQKPLGDLVWDYFFTQPAGQGIPQDNLSRETILIRGLETNYQWTGLNLPPNHYLILGLSSGESGTTIIKPWHCLYDLPKETFSPAPSLPSRDH